MHVYCAVKDFLLLVSNYSPYCTSPLCLFPPSVFFFFITDVRKNNENKNQQLSIPLFQLPLLFF